MLCIFANAVQKCRLEFVEPRQAEKIDAGNFRNAPLVRWDVAA
jgi:hypothetical protein